MVVDIRIMLTILLIESCSVKLLPNGSWMEMCCVVLRLSDKNDVSAGFMNFKQWHQFRSVFESVCVRWCGISIHLKSELNDYVASVIRAPSPFPYVHFTATQNAIGKTQICCAWCLCGCVCVCKSECVIQKIMNNFRFDRMPSFYRISHPQLLPS